MFEKNAETNDEDTIATPDDGLSEEFMEAVRNRDPKLIWTDAKGNRVTAPPISRPSNR